MLFRYPVNKIDLPLIEIFKFCDLHTIGLEANIQATQSLLDEVGKLSSYNFDIVSMKTYFEKGGFDGSKTEYLNSIGHLKKLIATDRKSYELLLVEPTSASIASFAARDGRVDGIRIGSNANLKLFNRRYAQRLQEYDKFVEFDISSSFDTQNVRSLRQLLRVIEAFKGKKVPYLLSYLPSNPFDIRSYRGIEAIGRMYGLDYGRLSRSSILNRIVTNRRKLAGDILYPGVEKIGS